MSVVNTIIKLFARSYSSKNSKFSIKIIKQCFENVAKTVSQGGGPRSIKKHTMRNKKLLAHARINGIIDKDSEFFEFSKFAGLKQTYGSIPAAGIITGIGKVCGLSTIFIANDATIKGGTVFPITLKKQLRAQEIALENHLPVIYLIDSGGAFLPLQADIFPDICHGGRSFYNQAIMNSRGIPQIAIVCGSCTAGGAYVPTMSQEAIIVKGIGHIFLGGPPLVRAALGETISAEKLGGADLHTRVSGCADYYAENEEESFRHCRKIFSVLKAINREKQKNQEHASVSHENISTDSAFWDSCLDISKSLNVREIIYKLLDPATFLGFHEFKQKYGEGLLCGWGFIDDKIVGIVGNNGNAMNEEDCMKSTHFLEICSSRGIPIIFLHNQSKETIAYSKRVLIHQGKLLSALACCKSPLISIILRGSYGSGNWLMCSRSFSPRFLFTWPHADIRWDPTYVSEVSESKNRKPPSEADEMIDKVFNIIPAMKYSANVQDDGLFLPEETRKVLRTCLSAISQYCPDHDSTYSEINQPVFRF